MHKYINHYLLMDEPEKLRQLPNKCLKIASKCLESGYANWVKCTYGELRSVLGLLQNISWCTKDGQKQHLFQQHDFPFNVNKSVANNSKE